MEYQGCSFLEQGINFDFDKVTDCCILHHDNRGLPMLIKNYNGENIDWEKLFEIKENRINEQIKKTIYECENCYRLSDYKFTKERKISEFHFTHCRLCNAKCIYCSREYSEGDINYDTYPIIKDLIEKGYYKQGGEATFQGGEPSLMQHFNELIELFTKNGTKVRIHTSAIKYSHSVYEALKQNKAAVVISLDSGTDSLYKKIKQVDAFHKVIDTIKKYSQANSENVIIKYIIIPGINDNIGEIDNFLKLLKTLKIKTTALDIELKYAQKHENKYISPHIYLLTDYFQNKAKEFKLEVLIYSFLSYVLQNRKIKKSNFIYFKPLYKLLINKLNDKNKNIIYCR